MLESRGELRGQLPQPDLCAVAGLRRILCGDPIAFADRERFARFCTAVMRSYLFAARVHRRFGFQRPFAEVASDVASMETALLLREDPGHGCPRLREAVLRRAGEIVTLDLGDAALAMALRKLLRMRADQGLTRLWVAEHRGEALLHRSLKASLRRARDIRMVWDSRGRLVLSPESDTRAPQIPRETLASRIRRDAPDFRAARVIASVREILVPCAEHGGYCYFMDLVLAIHSVRAEILTNDPDETGAIPSPPSRDGEPERKRLLAFLSEEGHRIDAQDAAKDERQTLAQAAGVSIEARAARVDIAAEMVLRRHGLGDPARVRLSQSEMLRHAIQDIEASALRVHENRTTYLARRLDARLRSSAPALHAAMWRRWWRGP